MKQKPDTVEQRTQNWVSENKQTLASVTKKIKVTNQKFRTVKEDVIMETEV